jgi:tetratricopeptide (TPR) repeat protein
MFNNININHRKQILIVYIALTIVTLAAFWQVHQYEFLIIDDNFYVTANSFVQSGFTLEGFRWALNTTYFGLWHPLTWLSFMFDYELYGLNAGGYHVTNVILHVLSTLLLFWLFNRMTGSVWRSAFVAGLFALHPLHVESVAWVSERKDVLSGFFWMLTFCFYAYYTEKPVIRRYLVVLFCYVCALMSKPMVVTLPIVMLLLDYWPLGRLQSDNRQLSKTKISGIIPLWQVKEKIPLIILSAIVVAITLYPRSNHYHPICMEYLPLNSRLANAPVAFVTYLGKMFWPDILSISYPFPDQLPLLQVAGAVLLILIITAAVIAAAKRWPYLFVGWVWYSITVLPVIGIIQVGNEAMADRYTYLPSIGIYIILAWGIPLLFQREDMHKKIFFPAGMIVLAILAFLSWNQCGYWKNSVILFSHAMQVNKNNYLASDFLGVVMFGEGKNQEAIDYFAKTIRLKPDFVGGYIGRGLSYCRIGQYQLAINDYDEAIGIEKNYAVAYHERGTAYNGLGQNQRAIEDYNKAISLRPYFFEAYSSRGITYYKLGQYELAINDFNKAIQIEPNFAEAINNRGFAYFKQNNDKLGLKDAQRACKLGTCLALEWAKGHGRYR